MEAVVINEDVKIVNWCPKNAAIGAIIRQVPSFYREQEIASPLSDPPAEMRC